MTTLLLTVPIVIEANNLTVKTVALLDQGTQASPILDKISKKLNLDDAKQITPISTSNWKDSFFTAKCVSFKVFDAVFKQVFEVQKAYTVPDLKINTPSLDWPAIKIHWHIICQISSQLTCPSQKLVCYSAAMYCAHITCSITVTLARATSPRVELKLLSVGASRGPYQLLFCPR